MSRLQSAGHELPVSPRTRARGPARLWDVAMGGKRRAGPARFMLERNRETRSPCKPRSALAPRGRCAGARAKLAAREAPEDLVCPPSLPPEEEYKHFPEGALPSVRGRRCASLPNLCLTAPSSPSSQGALGGAAQNQRGEPGRRRAHARKRRPQNPAGSAGERRGQSHTCGRLKSVFFEVPGPFPPYHSPPPTLCLPPWTQVTRLHNQQDRDMSPSHFSEVCLHGTACVGARPPSAVCRSGFGSELPAGCSAEPNSGIYIYICFLFGGGA